MKTRFLLFGLTAGMALPFMLSDIALTRSALAQTALAQTAAVAQKEAMPLLHPLFSDNAVLQRDRQIPVWGWASPGETITVGIDGTKTFKTKVDKEGKWMVRIGPYKAGGPHTLTVDGTIPGEMATRSNILFGDVWLCSGQSNMEWGISRAKEPEKEIAEANFPNIRLFTVPKVVRAVPQKLVNGEWKVCNPTNIAMGDEGGFSAVGYFFGRKLHQELGIPIGLINSSWGGTIAEAWVSESALGEMKDFDEQIEAVRTVAAEPKPYSQLQDEWFSTVDPGTKEGWFNSFYSDAEWKTMKTPTKWENTGEPEFKDFDGIGWYRREVVVPTSYVGKNLTLNLGKIDDDDTTYWNGVEIGRSVGVGTKRIYKVPADLVKAGKNVLAIRVYDMVGDGGLYSEAGAVHLDLDATNSLPLAGDWKAKTSVAAKDAPGAPARFENQNTVTVLNNAMIAPLAPYGLKGAIWYQGESNEARAEQYKRLLPTLIQNWRQQFGSEIPFHVVQLAGYMAPDQEPKDDNWPRLREAQALTAANVKGVGLATAIDIGESGDIHPKNKQEVGNRLALSALAKDYGKKVEFSGPTFKSMRRNGSDMVLQFERAEGGLSFQGDADHVFAVAGKDGQWGWASAKIEKNTVVLNSPDVKEPTQVRYAWSNMPRGFLYNGAGLPAAPFRTDK